MSQPAARMQPAPRAGPATTARVGLSSLARFSKMRAERLEHDVGAVAEVVAELEARPRSTCPPPTSTTSLTSRWYSSDSRAALISCIMSMDSTLAGGRFRVMRAIPCAVSSWSELVGPRSRAGRRRRRRAGLRRSRRPSSGLLRRCRSKAAARPMPPLMHRVARPRRAPRRAISCSRVTAMRAPVAPMGWPEGDGAAVDVQPLGIEARARGRRPAPGPRTPR